MGNRYPYFYLVGNDENGSINRGPVTGPRDSYCLQTLCARGGGNPFDKLLPQYILWQKENTERKYGLNISFAYILCHGPFAMLALVFLMIIYKRHELAAPPNL